MVGQRYHQPLGHSGARATEQRDDGERERDPSHHSLLT